jgi:hypothetical protein
LCHSRPSRCRSREGGNPERYADIQTRFGKPGLNTDDVREALILEKQLKKWNRAWKIRLIEQRNPGWEDLYEKWSA